MNKFAAFAIFDRQDDMDGCEVLGWFDTFSEAEEVAGNTYGSVGCISASIIPLDWLKPAMTEVARVFARHHRDEQFDHLAELHALGEVYEHCTITLAMVVLMPTLEKMRDEAVAKAAPRRKPRRLSLPILPTTTTRQEMRAC